MKNNTENIREVTFDQIISIRNTNMLDKIVKNYKQIVNWLIIIALFSTPICVFTLCLLMLLQ
jgi:hypothetical protein